MGLKCRFVWIKVEVEKYVCDGLTLTLPEGLKNCPFLNNISVGLFPVSLVVTYWLASISYNTSTEAENSKVLVTTFSFSQNEPYEKMSDKKVLSQQKIALRHT